MEKEKNHNLHNTQHKNTYCTTGIFKFRNIFFSLLYRNISLLLKKYCDFFSLEKKKKNQYCFGK